jgi:tetratricopeptide (TPR) repeat protein
MAMMRIFVSHVQEDRDFCEQLTSALRADGADVWCYDRCDTSKHWPTDAEIQQQIWTHPVFIVVLSNAALASSWVRDQCIWAHERFRQDRTRKLLVIPRDDLAPLDNTDWPFLARFQRITPDVDAPDAPTDVVRQTLQLLALAPPNSAVPAVTSVDEALAQGQLFMAQAHPHEAVPFFERAAQLAPASAAPWRHLGAALDAAGRHEEALLALDCALGVIARDPDLWLLKGDILYALERYREALVAFDHALALTTNHATAWHRKADILARLEWHWDALAAYQQALVLDPENTALWQAQGDVLHHLWRNTQAVLAYDHALALDPDNATLWTAKGDALRWLCRHDEAVVAYERAIALDDTMVSAWQGKVESLYRLQRYEEALAICEHITTLVAPDPDLWFMMGDILTHLERQQEALAAYSQALALDPHNDAHWGIPDEITLALKYNTDDQPPEQSGAF